MDATDDTRPIMTDLDRDTTEEDTTTPQPWLRRFASVVGFASTGTGTGGNQAFS